jgi:hypothetical protein
MGIKERIREFVYNEIKEGKVKESPSDKEFNSGVNTPQSLAFDLVELYEVTEEEANAVVNSVLSKMKVGITSRAGY